MKSLSILSPEGHLSGTKSRLSAAKRPLSRGAKRRAFIRGAALALLCCVCTAGMAQSYEVPAWESFTLTNKTSSSVTNPAYQWYENGIAVNGATAAALTIAGKKVGVYVYTRTVTNADACGESNAITVKVTVNSAATAAPSHAASTYVGTIGTQQWSDVIAYEPTGYCASRNLTGSSTFSQNPSVAEYTVQHGHYYYSWSCAMLIEAIMCNNGWRFPSKDEFGVLVSYVQDNYSTHTLFTDPTVQEGGRILPEHPDFKWGYDGFVNGNAISYATAGSTYWSATEDTPPNPNNYVHRLSFNTSGFLDAKTGAKIYGCQVRCVK